MQGMTVAFRFTLISCVLACFCGWLLSTVILRGEQPLPPQPIQVKRVKPWPTPQKHQPTQPALPPIVDVAATKNLSSRRNTPAPNVEGERTHATRETTQLPPIVKPSDVQVKRPIRTENSLRLPQVQVQPEKPQPISKATPPRPLPAITRDNFSMKVVPVPEDTSSPKTVAQIAPSSANNVRAATFKGITPGNTSSTELLEALGKPKSKEGEQQQQWVYHVSNFRKVVFNILNERVESTTVHLVDSIEESQVATQLGLAELTAVDLVDSQGRVEAIAYPERGVILRRDPQATDALVRQIVLQPISADLFLVRAESPGRIDFSKMLADIEYAQKLDPKNAHAYWLHAELLTRIGRPTLGAAAAERAVLLNPKNLRYQLTYADLVGRLGSDLEALTLTKKVRDVSPPNVIERAIAENQLGHWTAFGRRANYKQAVENHRNAIAIAEELLADASSTERCEIWQLLVDAKCAAAMALGATKLADRTSQLKTSLDDAQRIVDSIPNQPNIAAELQRKIDYTQLYTAIHSQNDIALKPIAERIVDTVAQLSAEDADEVYIRHGSYHAGLTLYAVAVLAKDRAAKKEVQSYIEAACKLLAEGSLYRDKTSIYQYQRGRTLYFAGAVQALLFNDHAEAVNWYDRALQFMKTALPSSHETELALQGERLVRMGVSYWNHQRHETAIKVTRAGMKMIEDAVKREWIEREALGIPYGNLASMYGQVGDAERAKKYDQLAAELNQ